MLVQQVLEDPGMGGAVICGPAGSGRRFAFDEAFARLADPPQLIRLNGSSFGKQVPGSILSFLMAQLDLPANSARHELVHGLARILCPYQRGAVVVLGRPELVDEESGSLLAQLTAMRKIKLVVICDQIQDLPGDILSLYRSGQLRHVSSRRMDTAQSRQFLQEGLGGNVSVYAAATLQYLAASNRGLMLKLARIWVGDGQLVQHDSTWVLRSGQLIPGPALTTLFNSMVSGLGGAERNLLSILALGGPVSLDKIHRAGLSQALDGLLGSGHVGFSQQASNTVSVSVPLLAQLLRRDLGEEHAEGLDAELGTLYPDAEGARTHTTLRGLVDSGQYAKLISEAERFALDGYSAEGWALDARVRNLILALHVKAKLFTDRLEGTVLLLQNAAEGLHQALRADPEDTQLARASQELELLAHRVAGMANSPDVTGTPAPPERLPGARQDWMSESLYLRALVSRTQVWAACDRQQDALDAVEHISRELVNLRSSGELETVLGGDDAAELEAMLLTSQLVAGDFKAAFERACSLASGRYSSPRVIAHAETVRGILYGLFDDGEAALHVLEPCLHQLRQDPPSLLRTAVEAVVTHALISRGRAVEGTELLLKEPEARQPQPPLGFFTWVAETFSSLAVARLESPALASSRLLALADCFRVAGLPGLQMYALAFALRLGHDESATSLERLAAACQGPVAAHYGVLGGAAAARDWPLAAATLLELAREGHLLVASGADNALLAQVDAREQRKLAKAVGCLMHRDGRPGTDGPRRAEQEPEYSADWMQMLTKRETQIARLAIEGHSNQDIARHNGVSIRTVEGHLYQVYSKLQVRNRQELTSLDRANRRSAGH